VNPDDGGPGSAPSMTRLQVWRGPLALAWAILVAVPGGLLLFEVVLLRIGGTEGLRNVEPKHWLTMVLLLLLVPLPACVVARSPVRVGLLAGFISGLSFLAPSIAWVNWPAANWPAEGWAILLMLAGPWGFTLAVPMLTSLVPSLGVLYWRRRIWPRLATTALSRALGTRTARVACVLLIVSGPAWGAWLLLRPAPPRPERPPWTGRPLPAPRSAEGWTWRAVGVSVSADRETIRCGLGCPGRRWHHFSWLRAEIPGHAEDSGGDFCQA